MKQTRSRDYSWSKSWIEYEAPNAGGVYLLCDKESRAIFVGKGNIREGLLSHWNRKNSNDLAIWGHNPTTFRFEVIRDPVERAAELIRELKPVCAETTHSKFLNFW